MNHRTNIIPLFLALCLFITGCSSSEQATGPAAEKESTVSQTAETDESVAATQSAETEDSKVSSELPSEGTSEDPQLLGKGQKQAETIAQPWLRQDLLTLDQEGRISLSANMNKISVRPDEELQGLHFTGPAAHFKGGRISVLGDFDLSGNPVGRISLSGITDSSHQVNVLFYLDEEEDPAAVLPLDHADGEDGWEGGYTHTIDVYGKIPAGSHKVSFEIDIEEAKGNEEADILIRHLEFSEASGIPVIYFKIDESRGTIADMNASPDHSARCYGTLDIQVPDNFVRDYPGGVSETVTDVAMDYVQGRGNSTWRDPDKKPYKFKLSKKTDLFGMGKNKNWALIANRFDNSLVRNRMTYWLGAAIGMEFTPQCIPVDVVMNDEYYGSYLLAENVKVDESRLAIDELTADDVQEPAVTGGYQLAMNPYYEEDPRSVFTTDKMIRFLNENPDFADEEGDDDFHGVDAQRDYIRDYLQKTEDAIFGEGFTDKNGTGYTDYLDLNAAADYWWIQEFSRNGDAYVTDSTHLYKKRGDKLFWGPLWDFDYVAWGNLDRPDELKTEGFTFTETPWFDHLMTDPVFTQKLRERWPAIDEKITEIVAEGGLLDRYYEQMKISERYDNEKHGFFSGGLGEGEQLSFIPGEHSYRDEIDLLKKWVSERQAWVNEHLEEISDQIVHVTFRAFDEVVEVQEIRRGKRIQGIPAAPEKEGYYFQGWFTEDGQEADIWLYINEDMLIEARYIDEESAAKADHLFFRLQDAWLDLNEDCYVPVFKTTPVDAVIHTVIWSSSDESIATVTKTGDVLPLNVGTVTITGTTKTGYSAQYTLHVYDKTATPPVFCESMEAAERTLTIRQGETVQNPLRFYPEDQPLRKPMVAVSADDMSVVTVDSCLVLTGIRPGMTTVHVTDYDSDCTTSFEVTVLPEGDLLREKDPVAIALDTLVRLDATIDPYEYTRESYAVYASALGSAVDRLQNESVIPIVIEDLQQRVFKACSRLVRIEP